MKECAIGIGAALPSAYQRSRTTGCNIFMQISGMFDDNMLSKLGSFQNQLNALKTMEGRRDVHTTGLVNEAFATCVSSALELITFGVHARKCDAVMKAVLTLSCAETLTCEACISNCTIAFFLCSAMYAALGVILMIFWNVCWNIFSSHFFIGFNHVQVPLNCTLEARPGPQAYWYTEKGPSVTTANASPTTQLASI
jgi:hypothetical protein